MKYLFLVYKNISVFHRYGCGAVPQDIDIKDTE